MNIEKALNWIAIIAVPVALFAFAPMWSALFADKKVLEYSLDAKTSINDTPYGNNNWPQLAIEFKGRKIRNGTLEALTIVNSGQVPVRADDFEAPIVIRASKPKVAIADQVVSKFPNNLPVTTALTDEGVTVEPLLMNPGDRFSVVILGKEKFDIDSVSARIVGVDSIKKRKDEKMASGVHVSMVSDEGFGNFGMRDIIHLPSIALLVCFWCFMSFAFIGHDVVRFANGAYEKGVIYAAVAFSYVMGLGDMSSVADSLRQYNLGFWGMMLSGIPVIGAPAVNSKTYP